MGVSAPHQLHDSRCGPHQCGSAGERNEKVNASRSATDAQLWGRPRESDSVPAHVRVAYRTISCGITDDIHSDRAREVVVCQPHLPREGYASLSYNRREISSTVASRTWCSRHRPHLHRPLQVLGHQVGRSRQRPAPATHSFLKSGCCKHRCDTPRYLRTGCTQSPSARPRWCKCSYGKSKVQCKC
jgi:hypothetical protein